MMAATKITVMKSRTSLPPCVRIHYPVTHGYCGQEYGIPNLRIIPRPHNCYRSPDSVIPCKNIASKGYIFHFRYKISKNKNAKNKNGRCASDVTD